MTWKSAVFLAVLFISRAMAVTDLLPADKAVVVCPPAFSWTVESGSPLVKLEVSTKPDVSTADVISWTDNGNHYFRGAVKDFENRKDKILYWRLVVDGNPIGVRSFTAGDLSVDPYYNIPHVGWPGGAVNPMNINSFSLADLNSIKQRAGGSGNTADRKLAFSYHIPYMFVNDIEHFKALIRHLGALAEESDVAVLFGLDGFEWWAGRPELWNWWDPVKPGYDPENKHNVEWTSWDPNSAVKDNGYRNWGSSIDMKQPHPNLASPAVIKANVDALAALSKEILNWSNALPQNRQYLFAGIKIGWEVCIGVNYYYGNRSSCDSGTQIGYAAVKTMGLAASGQLTADQLTRCVNHYFNELTKAVYEAGVPRRKIFTHGQVMRANSRLTYNKAEAALTPFANPGWSFYTGNGGPAALPGLDALFSTEPNIWWGNVEWGGASDWDKLHHDFESYKNNKTVSYFVKNWDTSLQKIINTPPRKGARYHWIHPPLASAEVTGQTARVTWQQPSQSVKQLLIVSSAAEMDNFGLLKNANVVNKDVTGTSEYTLQGLKTGDYYFQIAADGYGRRVISDRGRFSIKTVGAISPLFGEYQLQGHPNRLLFRKGSICCRFFDNGKIKYTDMKGRMVPVRQGGNRQEKMR